MDGSIKLFEKFRTHFKTGRYSGVDMNKVRIKAAKFIFEQFKKRFGWN